MMQAPQLIRPVSPADDNARAAGCTCNHRSSVPNQEHSAACQLHLMPPSRVTS
jgi:hypothetical protein